MKSKSAQNFMAKVTYGNKIILIPRNLYEKFSKPIWKYSKAGGKGVSVLKEVFL